MVLLVRTGRYPGVVSHSILRAGCRKEVSTAKAASDVTEVGAAILNSDAELRIVAGATDILRFTTYSLYQFSLFHLCGREFCSRVRCLAGSRDEFVGSCADIVCGVH